MPRNIDRSPEAARERLVIAAAEANGTLPSRHQPEVRQRLLRAARRAAQHAIPPVPNDEIVRIVEDAKTTGRRIHGEADGYVSRWLQPQDN